MFLVMPPMIVMIRFAPSRASCAGSKSNDILGMLVAFLLDRQGIDVFVRFSAAAKVSKGSIKSEVDEC